MPTKKFHPKLCHIVRNLTLTHIITLITVSVFILRYFFIETMTTTLPYESRTSKMQQEQVIQSDCRNNNTNFNHDISPYYNSNPRYNIGIRIPYFSAHCISDQKVRTVVVRSVQKVYF